MKHFYLLSRDPRFDALEARLSFYNYPVFRAFPKVFPENSVLVFPLGTKDHEILPVLDRLPQGSTVAVGRTSASLSAACNKRGLKILPLLEQKNYLLQNAAATAEGFLAECIEKTDTTLPELTFLILGYGNCGKAIAKLLYLCGAEVYIHSHSGSMAKAEADGFSVFPALTEPMKMFDGIINTVPAPIFDKDFFSRMRRGTRFFQIASGFSGIDPAVPEALGIRFYPLHALPAKYSPVSEGDNLFAALDSILKLSIPPERE